MFKTTAKTIGGAALSSKQKEPEFFRAVITSDFKEIKQLVKDGVDINAVGDDDLTALQVVAEKGDTTTGKFLLGLKPIDINKHIGTRHGDSALITAVHVNAMNFVLLLLQNGANPNIQNTFGRTALHFAVRKGNLPMVSTLLYSKAQPNIQDSFGSTPLAFSVIEYPSKKIAEKLMQWGANPNLRTSKIHPLLSELALNCHSFDQLILVKLLIDHRVNVNAINPITHQTALHIAAITGYVALSKLLIKMGASTHLRDRSGRRPFDVAIDHGHDDLVDFYKERERLVKDILKTVSIEEPKLDSGVKIVKKKSSTGSRSVRFTEAQSVDSDDEGPSSSSQYFDK